METVEERHQTAVLGAYLICNSVLGFLLGLYVVYPKSYNAVGIGFLLLAAILPFLMLVSVSIWSFYEAGITLILTLASFIPILGFGFLKYRMGTK